MSQRLIEQKVVILLGPPGGGKGTQAEKIARQYGLLHIDTGRALRAEQASGSELGLKVQSYMEKGVLAPFELVMDVIKAALLKETSNGNGFLFDGFPRNLTQAAGLERILQELSLTLDAALYLKMPHDILLDRLGFRLTCKQCDTKFNLKLKPPQNPSVCDLCSGELFQRSDDKPEVIENRLKAYTEETSPLIEHYTTLGVLQTLDANQPIEVVFELAQTILNPLFSQLPVTTQKD
jgi:adenylate kinase